MTKVKLLNWLKANDTIYAAPNDCKYIYYIKSEEDNTFVLDQLDIVERAGTRTFHPTIAEAKACANQLYKLFIEK
jgi:hypothetical protein